MGQRVWGFFSYSFRAVSSFHGDAGERLLNRIMEFLRQRVRSARTPLNCSSDSLRR